MERSCVFLQAGSDPVLGPRHHALLPPGRHRAARRPRLLHLLPLPGRVCGRLVRAPLEAARAGASLPRSARLPGPLPPVLRGGVPDSVLLALLVGEPRDAGSPAPRGPYLLGPREELLQHRYLTRRHDESQGSSCKCSQL